MDQAGRARHGGIDRLPAKPNNASSTASRTRRPRQPFNQGDLDGLCGLYAIVNAIRFVCPEMNRAACETLFHALLSRLEAREGQSLSIVADGVHLRTLFTLARFGVAHVRRHLHVDLVARRLPKLVRATDDLDGLWATLRETIGTQAVAIIELGGTQEHWTVAVQVTARMMRLFDSGRMGRLLRASCTIGKTDSGIVLYPKSIILIERK